VLIKLEYRMELRGSVQTPVGTVPGAAVELLDAKPARRGKRILYGVPVPTPFLVAQQARADAEGRFSFVDLKPGTYRLRVREPGFTDYLSPPFLVPWDGPYPVLLKKGSRLSGTLFGSEGVPEPDIPVVLTRREETATVSWTDAEGRFEFRDLLPARSTESPW